MGHRARPACGGCAVTRVLPVGCQDCQFLEWPVCRAPFLCWGCLHSDPHAHRPGDWVFLVEKETPGFQLPGAEELVCDSNSNEVE